MEDVNFLLYPHHPYDLAVLWDGKKVVAKPIIGFSSESEHFRWKGKDIFLRHFREEDGGTITPDWALEWLQERIDGKPLKVDLRMSDQDKFILEGVIKNRKEQLEATLQLYP